MKNENIAGTKSGGSAFWGITVTATWDQVDIGKMVHVATVVVPKGDHGSLGQEA